MKRSNIILLLMLIASACTTLPSTLTALPKPTKFPSPSKTSSPLPTSTIPTENAVRVMTINDIAVIEPEVFLQNGNIVMTICYVWHGEGIWELGSSAVKYVNGYSTSYTSEEISLKPLDDPQPGFIRCVKQIYSKIPETADLSQIVAEIQSIHLLPLPNPGEECKTFQERLTNSLEIKNLEIEAICNQKDNEVSFSILKKPNNMNTQQIVILLNRIAGQVAGPWIFQTSLK